MSWENRYDDWKLDNGLEDVEEPYVSGTLKEIEVDDTFEGNTYLASVTVEVYNGEVTEVTMLGLVREYPDGTQEEIEEKDFKYYEHLFGAEHYDTYINLAIDKL